MSDRRNFLQTVLGAGAGVLAAPALFSGRAEAKGNSTKRDIGPPAALQTPDVPMLPYRVENGVKVFHLVAEPVKREVFPGRVLDVWGYNGFCPGPTIQAMQGDRVRIVLENRLPEATSMHWHGLEVPIAMDGVPYISAPPIPPGGSFTYEFTLHQEGTYFYHSHNAMQQLQGMMGLFVLLPRESASPRVDRDFGFVLQEFAVLPNNSVPNSMSMEFNWLTINGKSAPATTPVLCKQGERVRLRFVNMGMDHHPIHLHGNTFWVTGTEAGRQPESTWLRKNTVLVGVAEGVDVEFVAENTGDWMVHCHLPHHMMNGMASMVGPYSMDPGMPASGSMTSGMGMAQRGGAGSAEYAPAMGRATGMSSAESPVTNSPLSPEAFAEMQQAPKHHTGVIHNAGTVTRNANDVPGFPQDAYMEMIMDEHVEKPETYGLVKGWTASMMGMMTLVRVLSPEMFDHIQHLKSKDMPEMEHHHG